MGIGRVSLPIGNFVGYSPPTDWVDISTVANNEINLLTSDQGLATTAFAVTVAAAGTYSIDWGDGTVETLRASTTTYQHTYTVGGGTACSRGYTTWKIRIYDASGNITAFAVKVNTVSHLGTQIYPVLRAVFGTTALTTMANMFFRAGSILYCYWLEQIILPATLDSVQDMTNAFYNLPNLKSLVMPTSMSAATNMTQCFGVCSSLPFLVLPATMNNLTNMTQAFTSCYGLRTIVLPTSASTMGTMLNCFQNCYSLESVNISNWASVTSLATAFTGCYNLKSVKLATTMNSLTTMVGCFTNCYSLQSVTLPTTATSLNSLATCFSGCQGLSYMAFPGSALNAVTTIATCFLNCYALEAVVFPAAMTGVTTADQCFSQCNSLKSVTLPTTMAALTTITKFFDNCPCINTINNLSGMGSTSTGMAATNTFGTPFESMTSMTLGMKLNSLTTAGTAGKLNALATLRLTNTTSAFTGSAPQISISYNSLNAAALQNLFGDIPNGLASKQITITGNSGDDTLVSKTLCGTTISSPTVVQLNTSSLATGMEVYGAGVSDARSITFQGAGDTVTTSDTSGIVDGMQVSFATIVTTTGITINTPYFVVNANAGAKTFQLEATVGGGAINLVNDGTGTMVTFPTIISIVPNTSFTMDRNAFAAGTPTLTFGVLDRSIAMLKGWTVNN